MYSIFLLLLTLANQNFANPLLYSSAPVRPLPYVFLALLRKSLPLLSDTASSFSVALLLIDSHNDSAPSRRDTNPHAASRILCLSQQIHSLPSLRYTNPSGAILYASALSCSFPLLNFTIPITAFAVNAVTLPYFSTPFHSRAINSNQCLCLSILCHASPLPFFARLSRSLA